MGRGDREKWGRGGRREAPQTLPSADPQPHHHGCHGGATATTAHGEGTAAAVSPSVARDLFGQPPFHFRISGGGGAPRPGVPSGGGGSVPWHQTGGSPHGWWPSRRRVALCWGGVVPINGGGGATAASVSLPLHGPPPVLGHFRPRPPQCHPEEDGGGAHPKIEPPSHSQREPPSPPRPLHSAEFPPLRGGTIWGWGT